jgi:hypothetical protein
VVVIVLKEKSNDVVAFDDDSFLTKHYSIPFYRICKWLENSKKDVFPIFTALVYEKYIL